MTLHKLSKCCDSRCSFILIRLRFNDSRHLQFTCALLHVSLREVIGCVPPSWLCQFFKLYLLLPIPLHVRLDRFRYCTHQPAGFVIFTQLAQLSVFLSLIFPILPMVGTCNIAQTVSDSRYHRVKHKFGLSGCQCRVFSCLRKFSLLPNLCFCGFSSLSCPSGLSLNIILDPFLFHYTVQEVCFSLFLCRKLPFG